MKVKSGNPTSGWAPHTVMQTFRRVGEEDASPCTKSYESHRAACKGNTAAQLKSFIVFQARNAAAKSYGCLWTTHFKSMKPVSEIAEGRIPTRKNLLGRTRSSAQKEPSTPSVATWRNWTAVLTANSFRATLEIR